MAHTLKPADKYKAVTEGIILCVDCKSFIPPYTLNRHGYAFEVGVCGETLEIVDVVTGRQNAIAAAHARANENICGQDAKLFTPKNEELRAEKWPRKQKSKGVFQQLLKWTFR